MMPFRCVEVFLGCVDGCLQGFAELGVLLPTGEEREMGSREKGGLTVRESRSGADDPFLKVKGGKK